MFSAKRLARVVVTLAIVRGVVSALLNGGKELGLSSNVVHICLWVQCPIVTKTMADGCADGFGENTVLSFFIVDITDLA